MPNEIAEYTPKFLEHMYTYKAAGDLEPGTIVAVNNDDTVAKPASQTNQIAGVCVAGGKAGESVGVLTAGVARCRAGATFAAGDALDADADGKLVPAAGEGAFIADRAATAVDDIVTARITK